jgi:sugar transferase (PEP-CTERM/EpsH1 system associated)
VGVATVRSLRVLLVTPFFPYPPHWGFGRRVFEIVRHLSARNSVSVLTYFDEEEEEPLVPELRRVCDEVVAVPSPVRWGKQRRFLQARSLLSTLPFHFRELQSRAMQAALERLLDRESFDLVQLESSQLSYLELGPTKSVLDEHNLEYELLLRIFNSEKASLRKAYNGLEHLKIKRHEQKAWRRFDACAVTSEREEEIVKSRLPGALTATVPNGVDVDYFRPGPMPSEPDSLLFTGLLSYRPNEDAVRFFVSEVFPIIRRARPDATFTAVGYATPGFINELAGEPNVTLTGRVPDIRPYLQRAGVVVVPLRSGGGTRLKVVEALAAGKAVVSTSVGCEGIAVEAGRDLLIGDSARDLATATLQLMADRDLTSKLGRAGRALVVERYSWASAVERLERLYARVEQLPVRANPRWTDAAAISSPPS